MTDALTASGGVAFSRHGWAMQREAEAMQMVWLQEGFFLCHAREKGVWFSEANGVRQVR